MAWYVTVVIVFAALASITYSVVFVVGPQLEDLLARDGGVADADDWGERADGA